MMANDICVSIANDLQATDINTLTNFPYETVIDLRSAGVGSARPMSEKVVKRLGNFFVDFRQMPCDLEKEEAEKAFLETAVKRGGHILVLTSQADSVRHCCDACNIPTRVLHSYQPTLSLIENMKMPLHLTAPVQDFERATAF